MSLVLLTRSVSAAGEGKQIGDIVQKYGAVGPVGTLEDIPEDARATIQVVITGGAFGAPGWLIDALPALRLVNCLGSGYEGVDLPKCAKREIIVTHNPEGNSSSTADHVICLTLACVRRLLPINKYVLSGQWFREVGVKPPLIQGLIGRRVGLLGMGHVGTKVAKRLSGFEVEVGYCTPKPHPDVPYPYFASAEALAEWCSVLIVVLRGSAATHHIINSTILKALGSGGYVINTTRGEVVDEDALIHALDNNVIAGVGMDVFEHEPSVSSDPWIPEGLLRNPNVVLTSHASAETLEARASTFDFVRRNLETFFRNGTVVTPLVGLASAAVRQLS